MYSLFLHLKQYFMVSQTQQMSSWLYDLGYLLTGLLPFLQLETYCSNLQFTEGLLLLIMNTAAPTTSKELHGMS